MAKWDLSKLPEGRKRMSNDLRSLNSLEDIEFAVKRIEELEAKLAESEARSEVLETLVMDVAADLYDGVAAHKIDQRIGDVMKKLNEEEEDQ